MYISLLYNKGCSSTAKLKMQGKCKPDLTLSPTRLDSYQDLVATKGKQAVRLLKVCMINVWQGTAVSNPGKPNLF